MNKYDEHMQDSAPDASRFDGFCRGDIGRDVSDTGERIIGNMPSDIGRIRIIEAWDGDLSFYTVTVAGSRVHMTDSREQAVTIARWWLSGCPS